MMARPLYLQGFHNRKCVSVLHQGSVQAQLQSRIWYHRRSRPQQREYFFARECHDIACDPVQEGATMREAIPGSEPVVKPKVVVALLRVLRVNKMK